MGYNQDLIGKWTPLLNSCNCQEDLKSTLATCCESLANKISRIKKCPEEHGSESIGFLETYSIPLLANVITHMNSFRVIDKVAMDAPIGHAYGKMVEARTKVVCDYTPIGQDYIHGKLASDYDINTLSCLISNRLDAITVNMLKMVLSL